jgi:tRNA (uracil-5-)-methyltransferase TRM9
MDSSIARRLVDLNRAFYQSFASPFAATRTRVQPGVRRLLGKIPSGASVADLGCGNANAAACLAARGHRGEYLGIDLSGPLLDFARAQPLPFPAEFRELDFVSPGWERALPSAPFDYLLVFAVLHHLPGAEGRLEFLRACRRIIHPGGRLYLSTWQFLRSEKLRARIVPWGDAGFTEDEVEAGDYLLDWRREGRGLRYIHVLDEEERLALARESGFREIEAFSSDGEGGRLADYAVWTSVPHIPFGDEERAPG